MHIKKCKTFLLFWGILTYLIRQYDLMTDLCQKMGLTLNDVTSRRYLSKTVATQNTIQSRSYKVVVVLLKIQMTLFLLVFTTYTYRCQKTTTFYVSVSFLGEKYQSAGVFTNFESVQLEKPERDNTFRLTESKQSISSTSADNNSHGFTSCSQLFYQ